MELNETVSITLTKSGADILNAENQRRRKESLEKYTLCYKELIERIYPINHYEGEEIQESLWVIFSWFGIHSYIGNDIPFTNLHTVQLWKYLCF